MARLLAFSDIHGALPAVRELARTESKDYDAIIIAGDIGGHRAKQFFELVDEFACPALYIYGNWDYQLGYEERFGNNTLHLHSTNAVVGDLLISGFSGCDTQWGKNPAWVAANAEVDGTHHSAVEALQVAKETDQETMADIDAWFATARADMTVRARDRRKRSFRENLEALQRKRQKRIARERIAAERVRSSRPYALYEQAITAARKGVQEANRRSLLMRIASSNWDPSRVVIVSHERLYRLNEDVPKLGAHLFGHRHGFKLTEQHGTKFVNVSALDPYGGAHGTYVTMEWDTKNGFSVTSKRLDITAELIERCMNVVWTDTDESVR